MKEISDLCIRVLLQDDFDLFSRLVHTAMIGVDHRQPTMHVTTSGSGEALFERLDGSLMLTV